MPLQKLNRTTVNLDYDRWELDSLRENSKTQNETEQEGRVVPLFNEITFLLEERVITFLLEEGVSGLLLASRSQTPVTVLAFATEYLWA